MTLKILVCGALLVALACGKDNPYSPLDNEPADTTGLDSTGLRTPKLIPLAPGASWKYNFRYFSYRSSFGGEHSETQYGEYSLRVTSGNLDEGWFDIEGRFKVDSLIYFLRVYNMYPVISLDTTYVRYPGVDTTLADSGTNYHWHIVTIRDSLWYDAGDSLIYFMPKQFADTQFDPLIEINLGLFDYPGENSFIYHFYRVGLRFSGADTSKYPIYVFAGENKDIYGGWMDAYFIPELGGMTYLHAGRAPFLIWPEKTDLEYVLKEFIPGIIKSNQLPVLERGK